MAPSQSLPGSRDGSDGHDGLLDGYGSVPLDEAVDPTGAIREPYRRLLTTFGQMGAAGLSERSEQMQAHRREQGVVFTAKVEGRQTEQVFPLDPVPRLIGADSWSHLETGAAQRARALNAFLDDVYGSPAGLSSAAIVGDGIIPERVLAAVPGFRPAATSLAPGGQPRATVLGLDLLTDSSGEWVVLEDNLQVPSGLGYVLANRRTAVACLPELLSSVAGLRSTEVIGAMLHRAMVDAAPPRCDRPDPQVVLLSDGPANSAWYEHRTLAAEMGVPVVHPDDLRVDGEGVAAVVDGRAIPVDVVYRRLGGDELLGDDRAAILLRDAASTGTVSIVNAPGNGVADDKAIYAFVRPMIRYYLGEEPILKDVGTWVLADPEQYRAVRGRMGDLVVKPVDGSGGDGVMIGPELTTVQIQDLEARVAAAPHRFIAQDVIRFSTHPTFIGLGLRPRHVDLRIFALSGSETVVVPAGLTRVAMGAEGLLVNSSQGGGSKDTWMPA